MKQLTSFKEHLLFIKKFIKQGKQIASFAPSSQTLAKALCKYINPNQSQVILELGAGTGAVTEVALKKMHPNSTLICIERDPEFVTILKNRCPRSIIFNCDAENFLVKFQTLEFKQADIIINGLPTPSIPKEINRKILENLKTIIQPVVPISQLTIMPWVYLKKYQKIFDKVEFEFILKSIPPGGVYHCWGIK